MSSSVTDQASLIGTTLSHYTFISLIGAGGMGEVYLAEDERLHRQVAIKVLAPGLLGDEQARRRFREEALTLSRLNHSNIATIHDFETIGDRDLLVMEYITGETLADRISTRAHDEREIARLGTQLLQGLAAGHARGIIHRDLKPRNVRVTPDGHLTILDYGLAYFAPIRAAELTTQTALTRGMLFIGTPGYMSPEQLRGQPADERSDLYAAGEILYELATCRRPFMADNVFALADRIRTSRPPPPSTYNREVSAAFDRIVLKALEPSPEFRYQRAEDFAVDLRQLGLTGANAGKANRFGFFGKHVAILVTVCAAIVGSLWVLPVERPQAAAFQPRDWVLVTDTADATGHIGPAVREALTLALQQSRYVNVLPRDRVVAALQRMERPVGAVVDEATGLDLCRRENVRALLAASVDAIGPSTRITVRTFDSSGRLLFLERADVAPGRSILDGLDMLAAQVRHNLGESLAQITASRSRPLAEVTTRSTQALERYSRAIDLAARGDLSEAESSLRAALALDGDFAMAHLQLAGVYLKLGMQDDEREHLERAYALRDKLTDRERYLIEASYHGRRDEFERAELSLRTLVGLYPDDPNGRFEFAMGLITNGKAGEAKENLEEALRLDPNSSAARSQLVLLLAQTNRNEEALKVFDQATGRKVSTPMLRWGRAMALFGLDRLDEARTAFRAMSASAEESERVLGELYLSRLLIYEGEFSSASQGLESAVRSDRFAGRAYPERARRYLLGRLALLRGDKEEALRQAEAMLQGTEVRMEHLHYAGYLQALAGDMRAADDTLKRLRTMLTARPNAFGRSSALHLEGEIAARRDRIATELLHEADAAFPIYYAHVRLAELAERQKDWAAAVTEWTEVIGSRGDILRDGFPADLPVAELRRARNNARVGNVADAKAGYEHVLGLWQRGDDTTLRREAADDARQLSSGGKP